METALISGAHGFIGKHLTAALQERGITPLPIPREYLYNFEELHDYIDEVKPAYIFHLAAYGNMAQQKEIELIYAANIEATKNLLTASLSSPYKSLINISSSSVKLLHQTIYSATKIAAEALCNAFVCEYNKPIITIRPYSVYGPGEADFRFIPTVFRSCIEAEPMSLAPDAVHDWVYVDDVVNRIIECALNPTEYLGKTLEIGRGVGATNRQVVNMIEEITGKKANIVKETRLRDFDNREWIAGSMNVTFYTLQEGLEKYYQWYTRARKGGGESGTTNIINLSSNSTR